METLKFKNFEVSFDGTKHTKSVERKVTIFTFIGLLSAIIAAFVFICILTENTQESTMQVIISFIGAFIIMGSIAGTTFVLYYKKVPKYFDQIIWLRKQKENNLEIGIFNDRIRVYNYNSGELITLSNFFNSEIDLIKENVDKNKPIYGIVELKEDGVKLTIENREDFRKESE